MSSDITKTKSTKTVDDLGLGPSINYAQAEQLRKETDKYIRPGKSVPTGEGTLKPTPTKTELLQGSTAQGRFSSIEIQEVRGRITALTHSNLAPSIGEGAELQKAITGAPSELQEDSENFTKVTGFAEQYGKLDKDAAAIYGRCKEFNKG